MVKDAKPDSDGKQGKGAGTAPGGVQKPADAGTGGRKAIKHIYVVPTSKSTAGIAAVFGLVFGLFVLLFGILLLLLGQGYIGLIAGIVLTVVFTVLFWIGGFVYTAVLVILYNVIAKFVGGIRLEYSNGTLNWLGPMSMGKIYAVFVLLVMVIWGLFFALLALLAVHSAGMTAAVVLLAVDALIVVLGVVAGFVFGAFAAVLYNIAARLVGGVKFTFEGNSVNWIGVVSYGKVIAVLSAIVFVICTTVLFAGVLALYSLIGTIIGMLPPGTLPPGSASMIASKVNSMAVAGLVGMLITMVFGVISSLIGGFVAGAIGGWLYDIIAKRNWGRIAFDME